MLKNVLQDHNQECKLYLDNQQILDQLQNQFNYLQDKAEIIKHQKREVIWLKQFRLSHHLFLAHLLNHKMR